ncbi:hypothetical protein DCAR_0626453 [Daucus carota subsp. sativus]|uniref:J domain-containing protein n=1 Tax=Daucus carota subsp. sativus TaxID=79200 RepID=A0A164X2Q8_DAUCS|nr:PREDICTED: uncharacterized protein LOC108226349 [Daucus carota subsp. sativus]WOH07024.1 hypothetical protein DCAR_0626453 [Daucus carota subsp. sativus]
MTDTERRSESQRLLSIAAKLLETRDLTGAKDFATSAQDSDPLLDGSDQILAISDVLIAADKKVNGNHDWYAILQLNSRCDDLVLLKKQYRKLAILLHPDKNRFAHCHDAFRLVSDAWDVVSDSSKKAGYDKAVFGDVAIKSNNKRKRFGNGNGNVNVDVEKSGVNFWTACPYCYNLHMYPRVYVDCCLKCSTCGRAIQAVEVSSMPSIVKGKDGFNCVWGCFPMGYAGGNGGKGGGGMEFPNWMPKMFPNVSGGGGFGDLNIPVVGKGGNVNMSGGGVGFGNLEVPKVGRGRKVNVSGRVGAESGKLNVSEVGKDKSMTRAPVNDVTAVQKLGTRKRGRPRKEDKSVNVAPVNDSAEGVVRTSYVPEDEYVTRAPVYDVTAVQNLGTRKRGRPRKNPK